MLMYLWDCLCPGEIVTDKHFGARRKLDLRDILKRLTSTLDAHVQGTDTRSGEYTATAVA